MILNKESVDLSRIPTKDMVKEICARHEEMMWCHRFDCTNLNQIIDLSWGIQDEMTEFLYIIFVSGDGNFIALEKQTSSDPAKLTIGIRHIISQAIKHAASAIVLVHNHPHGSSPLPSKADIDMTCLVFETMNNLSMTLIDHVIASTTGLFSMREAGIIEQMRKVIQEHRVCAKLLVEGETNEEDRGN
ncbi:MAG: JAB domain-containing protein [Desulfoplanes sp.]